VGSKRCADRLLPLWRGGVVYVWQRIGKRNKGAIKMTREEFVLLAYKKGLDGHGTWRAGKMYDALVKEGYEVVGEGICEKSK
jgi:hypothetical protein